MKAQRLHSSSMHAGLQQQQQQLGLDKARPFFSCWARLCVRSTALGRCSQSALTPHCSSLPLVAPNLLLEARLCVRSTALGRCSQPALTPPHSSPASIQLWDVLHEFGLNHFGRLVQFMAAGGGQGGAAAGAGGTPGTPAAGGTPIAGAGGTPGTGSTPLAGSTPTARLSPLAGSPVPEGSPATPVGPAAPTQISAAAAAAEQPDPMQHDWAQVELQVVHSIWHSNALPARGEHVREPDALALMMHVLDCVRALRWGRWLLCGWHSRFQEHMPCAVSDVEVLGGHARLTRCVPACPRSHGLTPALPASPLLPPGCCWRSGPARAWSACQRRSTPWPLSSRRASLGRRPLAAASSRSRRASCRWPQPRRCCSGRSSCRRPRRQRRASSSSRRRRQGVSSRARMREGAPHQATCLPGHPKSATSMPSCRCA